MSLKDKAVSGLFWSIVDSFANQGIQFVIGIVLARLLSPHEFGLIGMLSFFIALSQTFIDSGFSNALIRKQNCTQEDYSTIYYFNIGVGIITYLLFFASSGLISNFFNEPQLQPLIQVIGIGFILNSFGIIQRAQLTKALNFKLQTRISLASSIGSGVIAIAMAYAGYGVWSLVALTLSRYGLTAIFFRVWTKWVPKRVFSVESFRELFSYSSKLLASGLIDTAYKNIYYLIIGKYFSAIELGYYTRADQFKALPSQNLNSIISRVSYPLLAGIQDDKQQLKKVYKKLIRSTMLVTFVLMLGMAVVAKPMIATLIGERWLPVVPYLQLLCFVGMFYPLHSLNLNMLKVLGRSDLFLRLEIIKKVLSIPVIIIGIFWGIEAMIYGMIFNSLIATYLNSFWSEKMIDYSLKEQILDILPSFGIASIMSGAIWLIGQVIHFSAPVTLSILCAAGALIVFSILHVMKFDSYVDMRDIIKNSILKKLPMTATR